MVRLPESLVLVPEFLELIDDLIVPADLLVDDEEQGIDWEHGPKQYAKNFCFHDSPPIREGLSLSEIQKRFDALGAPPRRVGTPGCDDAVLPVTKSSIDSQYG